MTRNVAIGAGLLLAGLTTARPMAPIPNPMPREGVIAISSFQPEPPLEFFTPSGTELKPNVALGRAAAPINPGERVVCPLLQVRLSPDTKRILAIKLGPIPQNTGLYTPNHLWVFDRDAENGPTEPLLANLRLPSAVWSPDGTRIYGSSIAPDKEADPIPKSGPPYPLECWSFDLKTREKTALKLPLGHKVEDISPDGKTLLTVRQLEWEKPWLVETYLVPLATLKPQRLKEQPFDVEQPFEGMRFSPDGSRVLGTRHVKVKNGPVRVLPFIVAVADGAMSHVRVKDDVSSLLSVCWSPDNKRIAYHWLEILSEPNGTGGTISSRLTVADADGGNAKVILRRDAAYSIRGLDWK